MPWYLAAIAGTNRRRCASANDEGNSIAGCMRVRLTSATSKLWLADTGLAASLACSEDRNSCYSIPSPIQEDPHGTRHGTRPSLQAGAPGTKQKTQDGTVSMFIGRDRTASHSTVVSRR